MLVAAEVFTDLYNSSLITGDFEGVCERESSGATVVQGFRSVDVISSVPAVQVRRNVFSSSRPFLTLHMNIVRK